MFNPTESSVIDLRRSIADLKTKKSKLSTSKRELELKLATLTSRVRASSRTLPQCEYKDISRKQVEYKQKIYSLDREMIEINDELRKKGILGEEIRLHLKNNGNSDIDKDGTIKERLIVLRDNYMEFSSDVTRISSMRAMASKVAEEIEGIIKTL